MSDHREDLVSVIVPVYNVSAYLEECIRSICGQTYQKLEIILIDDGSTDGSGEICDQYAEKDERILVRHQENRGVSAARNLGLDIMHGNYIAFVDADDVIHEEYLERLYSLCIRNQCEISCCGYQDFVQKEGSLEWRTKGQDLSSIEIWEGNRALAELNKWRCTEATTMVVIWNKLYIKKVWNMVRFPVNTRHEDEFVIHHVLANMNKMAVTMERLYGYRQHGGSYMNSDKPEDIVGHMALHRALRERIRFYSKEAPDLVNDAVHHLLQESNSFYDLFLKNPTEGNKEIRKELVHQYRVVYGEYYEYIKRKEKIAGMLFTYLPSVYHAIVYFKWKIQEIMRKRR